MILTEAKDILRNFETQACAAFVEILNSDRAEALSRKLAEIDNEELANIFRQNERLAEAFAQIADVEKFIGNKEHILGNMSTKHGEIAEHLEVAYYNAINIVKGGVEDAVIDGASVPRTGPVDYIIGDTNVQSKFIQGEVKNLDHVIAHMKLYPDFAKDANSLYHIPKDRYEDLLKVRAGETLPNERLTTALKLREKMSEIEKLSGRPFDEIVKPSHYTYKEVQIDAVTPETGTGEDAPTIKATKDEIKGADADVRKGIKDKAEGQKNTATANAEPSLQEAGKAGAIGAAVGGLLTFGFKLYEKKKGKKWKDISGDDWNEIFKASGVGALKGGISGTAIYGLTNFCNTSAPVAAAFVSSAIGLFCLVQDYRECKITKEELISQGEILCLGAGVSALGATVGQVLIPIPGFGAVIGSTVSNVLFKYLCQFLNEKELKEFEEFKAEIKILEQEANVIIDEQWIEIKDAGRKLQEILDNPFSRDTNALFVGSIGLATVSGVPYEKILSTEDDIDAYFLS